MTSPVNVVVPADIDDPAVPSGGNAYDRRVCRELVAAGRPVHEIAVAGEWPRPGPAARAALAGALAALPDGAAVLLDGLVACGVPDVVVPQAGRLALVVLVHLPLGEETADLAAQSLVAAEGEVLRAADAVVATSPWTARRLVATHGLAAPVHVATPGVDPAPLAQGTPDRLLCVGSISPTKGQDLLVEALAAVADLAWSCDLVGAVRRDPGHVELVRRMITHHGLDDRIRVTGPLVGDALEAAFDAAGLLVLPSRVEAYGMVVTEALARGIPVLAAASGGLPETVGGSGLLVPPGDAGALAAALRRWLGEPGLRDELQRAAALRRLELDGWEVTARCLGTVLDARCGTRA